MRRGVRGSALGVRTLLLGVLGAALSVGGAGQTRVIDDFTSVAGWRAAPSEGVTLAVGAVTGPEPAMRLDFDFHGRGGWAAVRKDVDLELPDNYEFTFRIRGDSPSENLEFKLVDPLGENVWWSVRRDFGFSPGRQTIRIKKRQVSFAWGPAGGGEPTRVAAIELAITAGSGGKGTVWISSLALTALPPDRPYTGTPVATASSSLAGRFPAHALTGAGGGWHGDPGATGAQWLQVDFGERRELGGLVVDWDGAPGSFAVETSEDGVRWRRVWEVAATHGARSFVPMPEADARWLRLVLTGRDDAGVGIRKLDVEPLAFAATPTDFIASVAKASPRGLYPRSFLGEMSAWTIAGPLAPTRPPGLLGADGAFEPAPRTFSVEPFVLLGDRLVSWAEVTAEPSLADRGLPAPTVTWRNPSFNLEVTAFADAERGSTLLRYRVVNHGRGTISPRLLLAIRPLQVNPPSQFLNLAGGVGRIARIAAESGIVRADGLAVTPLAEGWRFGATSFDDGDVVATLAAGRLPEAIAAADRGGLASGALAFDLDLPPGTEREVWIEVGEPAAASAPGAREAARRLALAGAAAALTLPYRVSGGEEINGFARTVAANLAYILESREGPALRPGTRSYARSWIRDGAMMAAALLRLGHPDEVRDYLRWYAPFQFAGGRVPCCVDRRGADPVAENDSDGELLFLAAEYLRYTNDTATVEGVWPHLVAAVGDLDRLRGQTRTEAFRAPGTLAFVGLLPESISHEGYSAKPMHSYWDDFWALAGLDGAAWTARKLGREPEATAWDAMRDQLRSDVLASIARVRDEKHLAYVPGCAELGDFDATSTTVALWPAGVPLPREAVEATFERYWREAEARFAGSAPWESYTPYEWRNVGAFVRLGWRDRAVALARWLMADRMPAGWDQWPEIVWRDRAKAQFLGDLPHAWVGSDFIRAFLDMLAFERSSDQALVIGAGVPSEWLAGDGITVERLRTRYGALSFTMRRDGETVSIRIEGGIAVPPGGIFVRPPLPAGACVASVNGGHPVRMAEEVAVRELPAEVRIAPAMEER